MKVFLSIITLLTAVASCVQAQMSKTVTLYGYAQPVISGAPPQTIQEEGGREAKTKPRTSTYNYFIYLSGPANIRIYPVEMWLKGVRYGIKSSEVKTPIQQSNANIPEFSKPVVLVPKTTKTVMQLNTTSAPVQKAMNMGKAKASVNELVVVYRMGGKFYYAVVKKLTVMEPVTTL